MLISINTDDDINNFVLIDMKTTQPLAFPVLSYMVRRHKGKHLVGNLNPLVYVAVLSFIAIL